jgi:hypothetical protein
MKDARPRNVKLNKELEALRARNQLLERSFKHWFVPAKSLDSPCKTCGLSYRDTMHRDMVEELRV